MIHRLPSCPTDAVHEPYEFRVSAPIESGGGPPHSKTLARWPQSRALPQGFGVRRPFGALDFPGRFIVPMHARKRMEAFHEPQGAAGILPAGESEKSSADETSAPPCRRHRPACSRFMVPMHGKNGEGAFHELTHLRHLPGGELPRRGRTAPLLRGTRGGVSRSK
jgi:hypothetical protein